MKLPAWRSRTASSPAREGARASGEGVLNIKSILISVIASCIVSFTVSRFSVKHSFEAIDNYVRETIDDLYDALDKLTNFQKKSK